MSRLKISLLLILTSFYCSGKSQELIDGVNAYRFENTTDSLIINNVSTQIPDNCFTIDSIYILSIEFDIIFAFSLSRMRFKECFYDDGKYDIVRDRDKINEICKLLKDLKPVSTDNIKCDCNKQKIIIDKRGVPRFIDSDALDIRTLLVFQRQNKQDLIWISHSTTEIDCKMYLTSESLYSYIYNYKYSHIIKKINK